jgi:hypothetical protein
MGKLKADMVQAEVDPAMLSARANAHLEALAFLQEHPEFLACPQNQKALLSEFERRGVTNPTVADFESAYDKAKKAGKVLTREKASQVFAVGSADDIKALAESQGTPRYDSVGRLLGHDLPEGFRQPAPIDRERENRAGRATGSYLRSLTPTNVNDKDYKPSKREFLSWGADRQREWMEESGVWGGDLPAYLR